MSNEIFDRETKLDLLVNVIPLFILAFFIVGFVVFAPFGIDPLASSIQLGLVAIPFVLLTVLTYFAAVAVAGSERSGPVYLPGQAGVSGAEPLEVPGEDGEESASDDEDAAGELEGERTALDEDGSDSEDVDDVNPDGDDVEGDSDEDDVADDETGTESGETDDTDEPDDTEQNA